MSDKVLVSASTAAKAESTVAALVRCGLAAERIQTVLSDASPDSDDVRRRAVAAAGVVLSGGPDLDPVHFGEAPLADGNLAIQPERDRVDLELLAGAQESRVPVWGICRGMQVLNVFLGGTLWQDLPSQLGGSLLHDLTFPADALVHGVTAAAPETRTATILGRETARVNSRHHQAIRALAATLAPAGFAPDGLVEAVELVDHGWWVRAVQWHPEDLVSMPQQRALWDEFLTAIAAAPPLAQQSSAAGLREPR